MFALRTRGRRIVAATGRDPVAGLVLHDLRTTLRKVGRRTKARRMLPRRVTIPLAILVGILLWRRAMRPKEYVDVVYDDASLRLERGVEADDLSTTPRAARAPGVTDDELRSALREHALLEGDFVLRSGRRSSHYFDKYRFETRPELLEAIGARVAGRRRARTGRRRLAGSSSGRRRWRHRGSSRLPFLIVREDYGTANRIEGAFETGERVCLVEDVVTSGGPVAAVEALREAGLECRTAVCVVDREEGGTDELARVGVRLRAAFSGRRAAHGVESPANRMVERKQDRC